MQLNAARQPFEKAEQSRRPGALEFLLVGLLFVVFICAYAFIIFNADKGFDITDESFYLLNIFNPYDNIGAVSEFGKYFNLISEAIHDNVKYIRIFGILFILSSSLYYSWSISSEISDINLYRAFVCIIIGISAISIFRYWLITPSYNAFVLSGAMVVAASVIKSFVASDSRHVDLRIGVALAIGGALVAIGRPTSALAIGAVAGLWIASVCPFHRTIRIGLTAVCAFILLLLLHVFTLGGGPESFLTRTIFAKDLAATLDAGHEFGPAIGRLFSGLQSVPSQLFSRPCLAGAIATLVMYFAGWPPRVHLDEKRIAQSCVAGVAALVVMTAYSTQVVHAVSSWGGLGVRLVLLLLLQFLFFKIVYRLRGEKFPGSNAEGAGRSPVIAAFALASIAFVAPFGGTGEVIRNTGTEFPLYVGAALFLAMAIIPAGLWLLRASVVYLFALLPLLFIFYVSLVPYRLPGSISQQTHPITLPRSSASIFVDLPTANWANALRSGAREHGWIEGTPLVDLTGATPGAALVLGANAPVTPWIVGGYKGSRAYAATVLAAAGDDTLDKAWILTAPLGTLKIDETVLNDAGLDFPAGYELVGETTSGHRNERQLLWKPVLTHD